MAQGGIASRWRELSGSKNWDGLLDPLDLDLRRYLLIYGDLAQATYDTFNSEMASKNAGTSRYSRDNLFVRVGLSPAESGFGRPIPYKVTKYVYATSGFPMPEAFMVQSSLLKESNWIGYVAVATDVGKEELGRRDIVVVWRGTVRNLEWVSDFDFTLVPATAIFPEGNMDMLGPVMVHRGWLSIYTSVNKDSQFNKTSARDQVLAEIKRLKSVYKKEEMSITVVGHSLGASVATLNAADIAHNGFNGPPLGGQLSGAKLPVTAFVYASPKVGDINFQRAVSMLTDLRILRVRNIYDTVPTYPQFWGYFEVGQELVIDTTRSPYLKITASIVSFHLLETYLHGLAGTQGSRGGFKLEVDRDVALVNKGVDALTDEHHVPIIWWVEKNKGMAQTPDGHWQLQDHEDDPGQ